MSWPLVELGDVCEIKVGKTPSRHNAEYWGEGEKWLSIRDMSQGSFIERTKETITEKAIKETNIYLVEKGTVLFSFKLSIGKIGIAQTNLYTNEAIAALPIKDDSKLCNDYLVYALTRWEQGIKSHRAVMGATLNKEKLLRLKILLPPLDEQKRIAAILDKADAIRRKRQQAINLADDFLRSVFLDMFGDPVTNTKGFPKGTIRNFVATANYGSSGKASETEGEYPILRMGNITYKGRWDFTKLKYIDLCEKDKPKYLAEKGDLLFNRTNSKELVGKTAVFEDDVPMAIAGYLVRIRPNELGNNYYLSGYLNSLHGKQTLVSMCKSIVGMANINAQEVQNIKILLPPIELQNKFEKIVQDVNFKVKKHERSQISLDDLFKSLSQKAFVGEL